MQVTCRLFGSETTVLAIHKEGGYRDDITAIVIYLSGVVPPLEAERRAEEGWA